MPALPIIGAVATVAGVGMSYAQNRKARKLAMAKMEQDKENFQKSLENQDRISKEQLKQSAKVHSDNMAHLRKTFKADEERFAQQLAQSERGLRLQMESMQAEQARATQALNNQKAQLERQINKDEAQQVMHHRKKEDEGVSGTLLTGPVGVEKDKLKLSKKTLLGQ